MIWRVIEKWYALSRARLANEQKKRKTGISRVYTRGRNQSARENRMRRWSLSVIGVLAAIYICIHSVLGSIPRTRARSLGRLLCIHERRTRFLILPVSFPFIVSLRPPLFHRAWWSSCPFSLDVTCPGGTHTGHVRAVRAAARDTCSHYSEIRSSMHELTSFGAVFNVVTRGFSFSRAQYDEEVSS